MSKEEYRKIIYSQYVCGIVGGGFFKSQERCYEILNERKVVKLPKDYSTRSHHYKVKW